LQLNRKRKNTRSPNKKAGFRRLAAIHKKRRGEQSNERKTLDRSKKKKKKRDTFFDGESVVRGGTKNGPVFEGRKERNTGGGIGDETERIWKGENDKIGDASLRNPNTKEGQRGTSCGENPGGVIRDFSLPTKRNPEKEKVGRGNLKEKGGGVRTGRE